MIIHLDMDAFYASVEIRERPELACRPVIVGGTAEGRGVVSAANYPARQSGIHSAMPMRQAQQLCPGVVRLPVRMSLYNEVSAQIRDIMRRYTPCIEPLSLDEAFLDCHGSERLFGPATRIARHLKDAIFMELGLVASVGIAPNKFLAKLASDIDKPDGFRVIHEHEVQAFLDPLPVTRLWGVGKATEAKLYRLGITTIKQVRIQSSSLLKAHLGQHGIQIQSLAQGLDSRRVVPEREEKSISHEHTFAVDIQDIAVLQTMLMELTEQLGWRLRQAGLMSRTINVKIRYHDFQTRNRHYTLPQATDNTSDLWQTARMLLRNCLQDRRAPVRLIGVGVNGLIRHSQEVQQISLFESLTPHSHSLDELTDRINARFGRTGIKRAAALHKQNQS